MTDNVAITPGSGATIACDEVIDGTLGTVKVQIVKVMDGTLDSTNKMVVDGSGRVATLATQTGTWASQLLDSGGTNKAAVSAGGALKVDNSAVTQPVSGTITAEVVGNAGAVMDFAGQNASAPANALLVGAEFNTTPTTLTTGHASPLQMDSAGNLLVNVKVGGGSGGTSSSYGSAFPATGTAVGFTDGTNMVAGRIKPASTAPLASDPAIVVAISPNSVNANGQNTMANSAPVVIASDQSALKTTPLASASANGQTSSRVDSAASTNATSLKASAGTIVNIDAFNVAAYDVFLKFYNKASAPTVGTDTPIWTIPIKSGTGYSRSFPLGGKAFATGVAYAITKLQADSDTTAVAAHDLTGSIDWI